MKDKGPLLRRWPLSEVHCIVLRSLPCKCKHISNFHFNVLHSEDHANTYSCFFGKSPIFLKVSKNDPILKRSQIISSFFWISENQGWESLLKRPPHLRGRVGYPHVAGWSLRLGAHWVHYRPTRLTALSTVLFPNWRLVATLHQASLSAPFF